MKEARFDADGAAVAVVDGGCDADEAIVIVDPGANLGAAVGREADDSVRLPVDRAG